MAYRLNKSGAEIDSLLEKAKNMESDVFVAPFNVSDIMNAVGDGKEGEMTCRTIALVNALQAGKIVVIRESERNPIVSGVVLGSDGVLLDAYIVPLRTYVSVVIRENAINIELRDNLINNAKKDAYVSNSQAINIGQGMWNYSEHLYTSVISSFRVGSCPTLREGESKTITLYLPNSGNRFSIVNGTGATLVGPSSTSYSGKLRVQITAMNAAGSNYLFFDIYYYK